MTSKKSKPRSKMKSPPMMLRPTEEMVRWSVLLEEEVRGWPKLEFKKLFGMKSLYRNGVIFAALPDKRGMFTTNSLIFKMQNPSAKQSERMKQDARVNMSFGVKQKWFGFEMSSERDLSGALEWLGEAFEAAGKKPVKAKPKK